MEYVRIDNVVVVRILSAARLRNIKYDGRFIERYDYDCLEGDTKKILSVGKYLHREIENILPLSKSMKITKDLVKGYDGMRFPKYTAKAIAVGNQVLIEAI